MSVFSTLFNEKVKDTIQAVQNTKSPVPRSCHIGNNTSNNWAFLALIKSGFLVQYDHTTYGVDEVCSPWLILGDGGIIEYCFDPNGAEIKTAKNLHLNVYLSQISKIKYSQYLNYALPAIYENLNLFNYFHKIAKLLSFSINKSQVSFDSHEILSISHLVTDILRKAATDKVLHLFISRWVSTSKKGAVVMENIRQINFNDSRIEITLTNGRKAFLGTIDELLDIFYKGLRQIEALVTTGKEINKPIIYPWISLSFGYLITYIKDFAQNSDQMMFWHGVGSASQYYTQSPAYQQAFTVLTDYLAQYGYLPHKMKIKGIPSFCCQLFATTPKSKGILEEMLSVWSHYHAQNASAIKESIQLISHASHPRDIIRNFFCNLSNDIIEKLDCLLMTFNKADANTLPVAHMVDPIHPMYHRYGISQVKLKDHHFYFPDNFFECKWGELELLTKTLAEIVNLKNNCLI
jgi:hypothetical protein